MIVFIPAYDCMRSEWMICRIDSSHATYRHTPGYEPSIFSDGKIYNGTNIYRDPEGADLYIKKEYSEAAFHEIENPEKIFKIQKGDSHL